MSQTLYSCSELTFVSENSYKHLEYKTLLGISDLRWSNRQLDEPQDVSIATLALRKLRFLATQMVGIPFFVEHSGLVIEAWRNLPGGLTRLFLDNVGNEGICRMMNDYAGEDRSATAIAVIAFRWPDGRERTYEGRKRGIIADEPIGSMNFGWDPIFIPDGQHDGEARTYAEMTLEEKTALSMRRAAAEAFWGDVKDSFIILALPVLRHQRIFRRTYQSDPARRTQLPRTGSSCWSARL